MNISRTARAGFLSAAFLERLDWPFARCRTPVGGLYLTGSDAMSCGIVGAMMGGLKCLAVILGGKEFLRLMWAVQGRRPRSEP
jgi:phytoene dehydrogenase-like protein